MLELILNLLWELPAPVIVFFAFAAFMFVVKSAILVKENQVSIIESFGAFSRVAGPGFHVLLPHERLKTATYTFSEETDSGSVRSRRIRTTALATNEQIYDPPERVCRTKDQVEIGVNSVIWYRIVDPVKAFYATDDFFLSFTQSVYASLRDAILQKTLREVTDDAFAIEKAVIATLDEDLDAIGVTISRFRIQQVVVPKAIRSATEKILQDQLTLEQTQLYEQAQHRFRRTTTEHEAELATLTRRAELERERERLDMLREHFEAAGGAKGLNYVEYLQAVASLHAAKQATKWTR
jgi:regulator of protease activity HflC (stomatin/prohibitin superfamily)